MRGQYLGATDNVYREKVRKERYGLIKDGKKLKNIEIHYGEDIGGTTARHCLEAVRKRGMNI